jgi:3'-phosphoadenosine 5'-phosphosulfate sulfotransferase (PAPS reductase)/FAD synthetase
MIDLTAYRNPALQFSGGKDSLACLYLLRHQLENLTVYWVNPGDTCPETVAVVQAIRPWIPRFVEIRSDVLAWRAKHGDPTDLVPASAHVLGVAYGMSDVPLSNRFDCCYANLMHPMHERMLADGVDAVIRGTKLCDTGKVPAEGFTGHYHVLLPIKHWTHEEVFAYLDEVGAPINPLYEHFKGLSAPECLSCTAWWDDGKAQYLKARHPERAAEYKVSLQRVREALLTHLVDLNQEIGAAS